MSRIKSIRDENKWDQAITEARVLLRKVKAKAVRVQCAIASFEESKAAGDEYTQHAATRN